MKQYKCVQVDHHREVAEVIEEYQDKGWRLHTYACAGIYVPVSTIRHYLLFERGE